MTEARWLRSNTIWANESVEWGELRLLLTEVIPAVFPGFGKGNTARRRWMYWRQDDGQPEMVGN
jgi:hypothetical protein